MKDLLPRFNNVEQRLLRSWGEEILLEVVSSYYTLKKLRIKKGKKGGLQYHRKKDECSYVVEGSLLIRYIEEGEIKERVLKEGEYIRFPTGCIHQEEALEDVVLIEVSTPFMNDRVRVEKSFGIVETGLPTTQEDDIIRL